MKGLQPAIPSLSAIKSFKLPIDLEPQQVWLHVQVYAQCYNVMVSCVNRLPARIHADTLLPAYMELHLFSTCMLNCKYSYVLHLLQKFTIEGIPFHVNSVTEILKIIYRVPGIVVNMAQYPEETEDVKLAHALTNMHAFADFQLVLYSNYTGSCGKDSAG